MLNSHTTPACVVIGTPPSPALLSVVGVLRYNTRGDYLRGLCFTMLSLVKLETRSSQGQGDVLRVFQGGGGG